LKTGVDERQSKSRTIGAKLCADLPLLNPPRRRRGRDGPEWLVDICDTDHVRALGQIWQIAQARPRLVQSANLDAAKAHGTAVVLKRDMAAQQSRKFGRGPKLAVGNKLPAFRACKVEVDDLLAI
jgi:hypothetical protein